MSRELPEASVKPVEALDRRLQEGRRLGRGHPKWGDQDYDDTEPGSWCYIELDMIEEKECTETDMAIENSSECEQALDMISEYKKNGSDVADWVSANWRATQIREGHCELEGHEVCKTQRCCACPHGRPKAAKDPVGESCPQESCIACDRGFELRLTDVDPLTYICRPKSDTKARRDLGPTVIGLVVACAFMGVCLMMLVAGVAWRAKPSRSCAAGNAVTPTFPAGNDIDVEDAHRVIGKQVESARTSWSALPPPPPADTLPEVPTPPPTGTLDDRAPPRPPSHVPPYWANQDIDRPFSEMCEVPTTFRDQIQELLDQTFRAVRTRDREDGRVPSGLRLVHCHRVESRELFGRYLEGRARLRAHRLAAADEDDGSEEHLSAVKTMVHLREEYRQHLDGDVHELYLWHGTTPQNAMAITERGFRLSMARSGTMLGRGCYFAECSSKSDEYSKDGLGIYKGIYALLLCRVTCGKILRVTGPDPAAVASALAGGAYDAVLGDREASVGTYREFVVASEDVIYPEYIVLYTRAYDEESAADKVQHAPAAAAAAASTPSFPTEGTNRLDLGPYEPIQPYHHVTS